MVDVALRTTPALDAAELRHLAAALGTYWDQPADVRAALVAGLPSLVDDLRVAVGDAPVASPDDSPAVLLRLFDRAMRRYLASAT
jgi:hypothetical protein